MTVLDRLVATPRLLEIDRIDLEAPPAAVWSAVRHGNLARSPLIQALFAVRTLGTVRASIRIDELSSSAAKPGFQLLADEPPHELAVGAIGKVWQPDIPFVHVASAADFGAFSRPGFVKVAWAIRLSPLGEGTHLEFELRIDATDESSWRRFRRYFALIGIGSRFIRRSLLVELGRELGTMGARAEELPLPGDELLDDAAAQVTSSIDIAAAPEAIWPWLVQMGSGRAGFYSYDLLDNGGEWSARELHPELQAIARGEVLPARPGSGAGFEVLRVEAPRVLVLGGLYVPDLGAQLPFASPRPERYWQVTWAFALDPLDGRTTRLQVRARAAFSPSERLHVSWIRPVHRFMESAQLRHLAERAEGRQPRDDWRDVLSGVGGAALMAVSLLSPFLRSKRTHWGLEAETAARPHSSDRLVPEPRWSWTHGVKIDAPAAAVWPWIAQIGADRGGFYSYQWLENLVGCQVRSTETVHPEWELREGDGLVLHPKAPPLPVVACERGRWLVAHAPPDPREREAGRPWAAVSWLLLVEPIGGQRCRLISRYRADCSGDLATRAALGPTLLEPIGFAMDRRMLLGVKERAERRARTPAPKMAAAIA